MNVYRQGTSVNVTVPFLDDLGNPLTVTAATYRVVDESETELVAETPLTINGGETEIDVSVDASLNALGDERRSIRTVIVYATTNAGVHVLSESYVIEGDTTLVLMDNSFLTLPHAMMIASGMIDVERFQGATQRQKASALHEAFLNIIRLRFEVDYENDQERIVDKPMSDPGDISQMTHEDFLKLPARMVEAIFRAQVVEADFILGGDPIEERRRQGLMSETIGESSNMFRPGKPMNLSVSNRAMKYLAPYIKYSQHLGR